MIKVLDASVASLIAAGEVVERPYSVVKELVENSIDAGATKITVEISHGGKKRICIRDNGCGMSADDAVLAFAKHATSKILTEDDLYNINTLGFRGEALYSICAVSDVVLTTKKRGDISGHRVKACYGDVSAPEEAACVEGTVIDVRNLFENTPARLKFLKSEQAEASIILSLVERLALSHPDISFTYLSDGSEALFTKGNNSELDAIYSVFGKDFSLSLIQVSETVGNIKISGYTGKPVMSRSNRTRQMFFVNKRLVKSNVLQNALESAYRNCMLQSRFPVCVLFIDIDSSDIDINVHPSKQEIKFSDDSAVSNAVFTAVKNAIDHDNGIREIPEAEIKKEEAPIVAVHEKPVAPKKIEEGTVFKTYGNWTILDNDVPVSASSEAVFCKPDKLETEKAIAAYVNSHNPVPTEAVEKVEAPQFELDNDIRDFRIVGEVFDCYIVIERNDEVLFLDKHALHERMNFEKLKTKKIETQILLFPITVDLGNKGNVDLLSKKEALKNAGFDIDDFGSCVIVREIPQIADEKDVEAILEKYVANISSFSGKENELLDELLYSIACKSAIKSGERSSSAELENLISLYFSNENKLKYCPHGRPITFSLSKKSFEKQFKRIV